MGFFDLLKYAIRARLRFDATKGHMLFKGERVAMVPTGMFTELYLGLSDVTGKGGAASTLYMGAKKTASILYNIAAKIYGEENLRSEETFGDVMDQLISMTGYGRCEVVKADFENVEVIIRMRGLLTSSEIVKSDVPVCHVERGVMTGIVEMISRKSCTGQEVKCQATGDEYCEFVINASM
ncbi:MAG: 4-vinyl reductase [Halobacteriota archaeon]|nr:4-vinyl reductase [Halobacteriota archaeon]